MRGLHVKHREAVGDYYEWKEEADMAHAKTTNPKAASNAGKVLANTKSTKAEKSAAASALSQTPSKKKGH